MIRTINSTQIFSKFKLVGVFFEEFFSKNVIVDNFIQVVLVEEQVLNFWARLFILSWGIKTWKQNLINFIALKLVKNQSPCPKITCRRTIYWCNYFSKKSYLHLEVARVKNLYKINILGWPGPASSVEDRSLHNFCFYASKWGLTFYARAGIFSDAIK